MAGREPRRLQTLRMKISLTFDNGPDAQVTPGVLDVLAEHAVKATFFTLGRNLAVPAQRAIAVRAFEAGHRIGNHTFSHGTPFGELQRPEDGVDEILKTDALLGDLVGIERLFRPFGRGVVGPHLLNRPVWRLLTEMKFTCVLWNCLVREHTIADSWVSTALAMCDPQEWNVVVLHDIALTGAMQQLGFFLSELHARSAHFTQDFPLECTPLRAGVETGPCEHLIAQPRGN
jgi:peptidoglycan-N-acetylglucosamine deacetylase